MTETQKPLNDYQTKTKPSLAEREFVAEIDTRSSNLINKPDGPKVTIEEMKRVLDICDKEEGLPLSSVNEAYVKHCLECVNIGEFWVICK